MVFNRVTIATLLLNKHGGDPTFISETEALMACIIPSILSNKKDANSMHLFIYLCWGTAYQWLQIRFVNY